MSIPVQKVEEAALEIMRRAAIEIPADYKRGIQELQKKETGKLPRFVIHAMMDNWEAADQDRRPMCADTGLPRYYVKVGNHASVDSGFVAVERALRHATAEATVSVPLRPNNSRWIARVCGRMARPATAGVRKRALSDCAFFGLQRYHRATAARNTPCRFSSVGRATVL